MFDQVSDTYEYVQLCFGGIFAQMNEINQKGGCLFAPWHARPSKGLQFQAADLKPFASFAGVIALGSRKGVPPPPAELPAPGSHCRLSAGDCEGCAAFGTCPTHKRTAHAGRRGVGRGCVVLPDDGDGPCLRDCTWSHDCVECCASEGAELAAARRQWEACRARGWAWRRGRLWLGGDWMSQGTPLGIGGPSSKCFCDKCHALLHETTAAGVPHLPVVPAPYPDPRPEHVARPSLRRGTPQIAQRARAFAAAQRLHELGLGKKPEPADFDSCLNVPLVWGRNPYDFLSCTPLHYLLGIGLWYINRFEWELKEIDAQVGRARGDESAHLLLQFADLRERMAQATTAHAELEEKVQTHAEQLATIQTTAGSEEAIARARQPKPRGRAAATYKPLPLEAEYRHHAEALGAAKAGLVRSDGQLEKLQQENVRLWSESAGPFTFSFLCLFDALVSLLLPALMDGAEEHMLFRPFRWPPPMWGSNIFYIPRSTMRRISSGKPTSRAR